MTTRLEFEYDWADEQQEHWETLASENLKSLDERTESHLDWLDKHSTISDLLVWKRPFKNLTNTITKEEETHTHSKTKPLKTVIHIALFDQDSIVKGDNQEDDQSQQKENVLMDDVEAVMDQSMDNVLSSQPKDNEITNIPATVPSKMTMDQEQEEEEEFLGVATRASMLTRLDKDDTAQKVLLEIDNNVMPMETHQSTIQIASPSRQITPKEISAVVKGYVSPKRDGYIPKNDNSLPKETPELSIGIGSQGISQSQSIKTPETQHQDEAQQKVDNEKISKQGDEDDEIQLVVSNRSSSIKDQTTPPMNEPQPTAQAISTLPTPTPLYKSPFMKRLFEKRTRSLEEDSPAPTNFITARPKASMSASSISSEISNSRSMSLLESKVDRKRSLVSIPEPIVEIEVSDSVPGSAPYKKLKTVGLKQSKASSVTNNIPSSESTKTKNEAIEEEEVEPTYVVPSWAKSPELESLLRKQSGLDPELIFGKSVPIQLQDIFAGIIKSMT